MDSGIRIAKKTILLFALGLALGGMHAQSSDAAQPAFSDQTQAAGLAHAHKPPGDTPGWPMHGGATAGDFNNDGRPDLFVLGGGYVADALFINNGDGTFSNLASEWGVLDTHRGVGAMAFDYDGDGWQDLYVTSMGDEDAEPAPGAHRLYRNTGSGGFVDVAGAAGVATTNTHADGYGAAAGDYDLDGDLDLYVTGWHKFEGTEISQGSRLFRNEGDGTFSDATVEAGVDAAHLMSFGAVFADMNEDRYPELLVAADAGTSRYYINDRAGGFTEHEMFLPTKVHNGMGTAVADFDRDGRLDWFISAIYPAFGNDGPPGNRLYRNFGDHNFLAAPESAGIDDGGWGWGAAAVDFNHDGWTDLVHATGWPLADPYTGEEFFDEPAYLFENTGQGSFFETALAYGLDHRYEGRGLVQLDYDGDGDLDIVICTNHDALYLYRNDLSGPDVNWLRVRLDSRAHPALAPNGWGARVTIGGGGIVQTATVSGGTNYLGRGELAAHFGLAGTAAVDWVGVEWPDGFTTRLRDVAANQTITVAAQLPYSHGRMVWLQPVQLVVEGLAPGERARFLLSLTGFGTGACYPELGGLCSDLNEPETIGIAVANAHGVATMEYTPPRNPRLTHIYTQVLIRRGPGGVAALKSNAIVAPLLDPAAAGPRSQ